MNQDSRKLQSFLRTTGFYLARNVIDPSELSATIALLPARAEDLGTTRIEQAAHPAIQHLLALPAFRHLIEMAIGPTCVAVLNRHNHVTIDAGGGSRGSRLHRDVLHWTRSPLTALILLAAAPNDSRSWISIIPGSHVWPIDGPSNGGGYWLDQSSDAHLRDQSVLVDIRPGDVLLIDSMLFHGAGSGSPEFPRMMATVALRSADELTGKVGSNETLVYGSPSYAGQGWWVTGDI